MDTIKINVGGKVFVTTRRTINRYPDTRLGNITRNETCGDENQEIYFDKNPKIFQSVLDYYRSGNLHINTNYCADYVKEELKFWGFGPNNLSPCCRKNHYNTENDKEGFYVIEQNFGCREVPTKKGKKLDRLKGQIWNFIEYPMSSRKATAWQCIYLTFVFCGIISCSIHCFLLRSEKASNKAGGSLHNTTHSNDALEIAVPDNAYKYVLIFSFVYNTVFTFETIMRLITCPSKRHFFSSLLNLIDVGSVVAYLVFAFLSTCQNLSDELVKVLEFSGTLVIFQGFRFYRLERFCERLRLILLSLDQSKSMLCLLTTILVITALIFAGLIHIVELKENTHFNDPITCFYWAIITMTTVGYGDVRPQTDGGKLIASVCATIGLLLLSMPIAIVANDFSDLYTQYKARNNYEKQTAKRNQQPVHSCKVATISPK